MSRHHPLTHGLALQLCIALAACSSTPQTTPSTYPDREFAALQQRLDELDKEVQAARTMLHPHLDLDLPLADTTPRLLGTVTYVGHEIRIHVDDNPDSVDLHALLAQGLFYIEFHDEQGYKGDALTLRYDAADSALVCEYGSLWRSLDAGDRAMTAADLPPPSTDLAPTREQAIAALQQLIAVRTSQLDYCRIALQNCDLFERSRMPPPVCLQGVVTEIVGRKCTIHIVDNQDDIDIAARIARRPFRISLYGTADYKGEAVSLRYDAATASLFCNVMFVKDGTTLTTGDRASTK